MKILKQKKASDMVLTKYTYQYFLVYKEQKHTQALAERIANEILSDKDKAQ